MESCDQLSFFGQLKLFGAEKFRKFRLWKDEFFFVSARFFIFHLAENLLCERRKSGDSILAKVGHPALQLTALTLISPKTIQRSNLTLLVSSYTYLHVSTVTLICRVIYCLGSQVFLHASFSTSTPNIDVASQDLIISEAVTSTEPRFVRCNLGIIKLFYTLYQCCL